MKVSHFNTFPYGGAAAAALRIHKELGDRRTQSEFYYHICDRDQPNDSTIKKIGFDSTPPKTFIPAIGERAEKKRKRKLYRLFDQHIKPRETGSEVFAMAQQPELSNFDWSRVNSDLVHLHWISYLADYPSFFSSIPDDVPIVWTLHDMNPFTGGCHYSTSCEKFSSGCGSCPQIIQPSPKDVSADSFRTKRKALANKSIHVASPSQWLLDLAKSSSIWPDQTTFNLIRLGFDLKEFRPIDKVAARRKLGIDTDAVLLGFGAEDIRNQRKGFHHLLNCLPKVETENNIECLVFGSGTIPESEGLPTMHHFGYVDSAELQATIYSAADIVIVPSREDNQPQVGLEAMACGTPVVGFNAGGIPEYVRDGVTGRVAELGHEEHLAFQISRLVDDQLTRIQMGTRARLMMEEEFDIVKQADEYNTLYHNALSLIQQQRRAA